MRQEKQLMKINDENTQSTCIINQHAVKHANDCGYRLCSGSESGSKLSQVFAWIQTHCGLIQTANAYLTDRKIIILCKAIIGTVMCLSNACSASRIAFTELIEVFHISHTTTSN